ncbi:glycosyl hydrolase [Mucilaginibacter myungsuensis]|uniref:Glycosyl hydrolase n=1 Tax=Mucilaginibacter myungsuensis TaxID=649104 RepID=A0A929KUD2_9SPHI|nr:glycosyl hydrolase [Mucilaginibacter myungsuensis]MBE9661347.1 glycosyl hydrolase [Mucilaginibacter myungsuensis]MDN3597490.1 hypothetical protein [Mucilaginibacter myungsuensis]
MILAELPMGIIKISLLAIGGLAGLSIIDDPKAKIQPPTVAAIPTHAFLNSIGVNTAISVRGEDVDKTIAAIGYTGIRWVRSGYEGNAPLQDYIKLHMQTGAKFSYGLMSGGTDIPRLLTGAQSLAKANALLALEGPNEPNNWGMTYQGVKGGSNASWMAVAKLQADLYKAVKADGVLKKYPVWSLSENGAQTDNVGLQYLQIPKGADAKMPAGTKYADYANAHNYFSHPSHKGWYDNQVWNAADPGAACKVDGLFGNYGTTWRYKFKGNTEEQLRNLPRVTTETGVTIDNEFTEDAQARLYINLYLAQFKRGWAYTSVYLLRDRSDEAGNQSFGFYKADYTPRLAAMYLHNLTTILEDNGALRNASGLSYRIINQPAVVHDLLLQNSNGKFQLVIWGEKVHGMESINIEFGKKIPALKTYDPTLGVTPTMTMQNVDKLNLVVMDHPVIIEL